jgi:hypothetical protein
MAKSAVAAATALFEKAGLGESGRKNFKIWTQSISYKKQNN